MEVASALYENVLSTVMKGGRNVAALFDRQREPNDANLPQLIERLRATF